jgi:hypothetical protein
VRPSSMLLVVAGMALAIPASAANLVTFIGPNSDSATQACTGDIGPKSGTTTVHASASCSRADVGTASGSAVAATGHIGAAAAADSHNGDSLVAKIGASAIYQDFVTFTSTMPGATSELISANFLLDGLMDVGGPVGGADLMLSFSLAGADFQLRTNLNTFGGFSSSQNTFNVEAGSIGPVINARLGTSQILVPLNSPVLLTLRLETGAAASGPGAHGLVDFGANSFKFAATPFDLPDGVTANAGDYIVNNRFIDPLAPTGGVPEPTAWSLMILGFGAAGAMIRRRRAVLA